MRRSLVAMGLLGVAAVVWGGGCGSSDEFQHVGVSGKVTLGGKPLKDGTITFIPLVSGPGAHETITEGSYAIARGVGPGPGNYRVEISSHQPTGRRVPDSEYPGQTIEETRNIVPDRYNINSQLQVEVKGDGDQTFDFALEPAKGR